MHEREKSDSPIVPKKDPNKEGGEKHANGGSGGKGTGQGQDVSTKPGPNTGSEPSANWIGTDTPSRTALRVMTQARSPVR